MQLHIILWHLAYWFKEINCTSWTFQFIWALTCLKLSFQKWAQNLWHCALSATAVGVWCLVIICDVAVAVISVAAVDHWCWSTQSTICPVLCLSGGRTRQETVWQQQNSATVSATTLARWISWMFCSPFFWLDNCREQHWIAKQQHFQDKQVLSQCASPLECCVPDEPKSTNWQCIFGALCWHALLEFHIHLFACYY